MGIIKDFTIERFHEVQNKYEALSEARKQIVKNNLIGRIISKAQPDLMQKYEEYRAEYELMLPQVEARADEVAKDFGMVNEESTICEVAAAKSLEGKLYVRALFETKDKGTVLDSAELKPEWFYSDDYKEQAAIERAKFAAREYEEYLRLKKKFEETEPQAATSTEN